jgi:hypothetical protein
MHRSMLVSAALLLLAALAWSRQDQPKQSPEGGQQPSAQQTQSQTSAPPAQQDSLAEAARKARAQKKDAPKAAKVFTNDNIPTAGGLSSVGADATQPERGTTAGAAQAGSAGKSDDEKAWRERFANLHHKLEQDQSELDVMQRELGVLNLQYYNDPMKAMQQQLSREDIDKKTAAIEAKKKDIEADKQAISDAEDDLRKAGGDPGWANPQ